MKQPMKISALFLSIFLFPWTLAGTEETEAVEAVESKPWLAEIADPKSSREIAVNLRGGDGINYRILSVLKTGRRVLVHEQKGDWLRVEPVDGAIPVWVHQDYLNLQSAAEQTAVCVADRVVIRAGAMTNSAPLGLLSTGQQVKVIKWVNSWAQIEAPVGTTAWISAPYAKAVSTEVSDINTSTQKQDEILPNNEKEHVTNPLEDSGDNNKENRNHEVDLTDLKRLRREFEARLQDLQKSRQQSLDAMDTLAGLTAYTATGRLKIASDGTPCLELAGRTTFYLRPAVDKERQPKVSLEPFASKTVGVIGRIVEKAGRRWIEVDSVTALDSPE